jgi:hypothetical protein
MAAAAHDGALGTGALWFETRENIGVRFGPKQLLDRIAKGEIVDPALIYFRSVPKFETGASGPSRDRRASGAVRNERALRLFVPRMLRSALGIAHSATPAVRC